METRRLKTDINNADLKTQRKFKRIKLSVFNYLKVF
jgi:hypothetical protein